MKRGPRHSPVAWQDGTALRVARGRAGSEIGTPSGLGSGAVTWHLCAKSTIPVPLPDEARTFLCACPEPQGTSLVNFPRWQCREPAAFHDMSARKRAYHPHAASLEVFALLLWDFLAHWSLADPEKCFHEFAFSARYHSGESLEPFAFGDFGVRVAPFAKQSHLFEADFALPDAECEMLDQCMRQLLAANLWHDGYSSP